MWLYIFSILTFQDNIGVIDLCKSTKLGIMVVVFDSGSAWILPLSKLTNDAPTNNLTVNQTTYIKNYENINCVDICDRYHLLALGLNNGNVIIYSLNLNINKKLNRIQFELILLTEFNPKKYDLITDNFQLSKVKEVHWSDGDSLSISWNKGIVIYSIRGIVIFSTLHHQMNSNNIDTNNNDPLTQCYPKCLKWLEKDTGFIMVTHSKDIDSIKSNNNNDDIGCYLIQINCLRRATTNISQNDSSKLAFLGNNYISIWRPLHCIDDQESTDYWSRIEIENECLINNWPIRDLCVSPKSDCFIITGVIGFAIYFRKIVKWKYIKSFDMSKYIYICVVTWLTNDLILMATFDPTFKKNNNNSNDSKYNLICVSKNDIEKYELNTNIPMNIIFKHPLTNYPIGIEVIDYEKLMIYFVDGVIHIYNITLLNYNIHHHHHSHHHSHHHNHHKKPASPMISNKIDSNPTSFLGHLFGFGSSNNSSINSKDNLNDNNIEISIKNSIVLAPFQTLSPHPVSLRLWKYNNNSNKNSNNNNSNNKNNINNDDDPGLYVVALDSCRDLYKINPRTNEKVFIIDKVHDFYLIRETRGDKYEEICLWTYSNKGIYRWTINDNKIIPLFVSKSLPHMTSIGICNTLNVIVYGRRIIRRSKILYTPRFAIHIDIRSYLHITIQDKLKHIGIEKTFDFVLKAIAGGSWRCLTALETILRSHLLKVTNKTDDIYNNIDYYNNTLPYDEDALLPRSQLRTTYVFYPNDMSRGASTDMGDNDNSEHSIEDSNNSTHTRGFKPKINTAHLTNMIVSDNNSELKQDIHQNDTINKNNNDRKNNNDNDSDTSSASSNNNNVILKRELITTMQKKSSSMINVKKYKLNNDVIIFLKKFPDYPGIVVNVARKIEPSNWKDLFALCGDPINLIEKSIQRNQLITASKYLYLFEKIKIELSIHYGIRLMELGINCGANKLVLSILRFINKLQLMMKESRNENIEIPQLNVPINI